MIAVPLIALAFCIVIYGLCSSRLSRSFAPAPMVFTLAGLLVGGAGLRIVDIDVEGKVLEGFGELTLGLILFADAASTNSRNLINDYRIPRRLLLVSLPLTIIFGAVVAVIVFPTLPWQEAALAAAILAPTDAALGLAVVKSQEVPERIRQALLVESGLNDGLALPAVLLLAALTFSMMGEGSHDLQYWLAFAGKQIAVGALTGILLGAIFGKIVHFADEREWISHDFRNLTSLGVAFLILLGADIAGGNGFIATFVGGLIFGSFCSRRAGSLTNFVEEEGQLFSLAIFFVFGVVLLPSIPTDDLLHCILYAVLSLTIVRMAPTALSLFGLKIDWESTLFLGWFGPRGLASILFLLIAVEDEGMGRMTPIESIVYVTVFLSVILHGVTAAPISRMFGKMRRHKLHSM